MQVFNETSQLKEHLKRIKQKPLSVGLVPTMGALHDGHAELIRAAVKENDVTICSIFVNPTQFNNKQDLDKYPRSIDEDLELLIKLNCDIVYSPNVEDIYSAPQRVRFDFGELEDRMEGAHRPGHFNGVALIVSKLFNIVNPDVAYFGQKDIQQFKVIEQLVIDLSFDIQLRCIPIIRQQNGLALSSRNLRLTEEGRRNASMINAMLEKAEGLILKQINLSEVVPIIKNELLTIGINLEYLELVDLDTFKSVENKNEDKTVALCIAAYIEDVRLIDNRIF